MYKYASYDQKNDIIFADLTDVTFNVELLEEISQEVFQLAASLPQKVFVLVCWKGTKMPPEIVEIYGDYTLKLLDCTLGLVRYDTSELYSSVNIRAQAVKKHMQGSKSYICQSKEEALEVIQQRKAELEQPVSS